MTRCQYITLSSSINKDNESTNQSELRRNSRAVLRLIAKHGVVEMILATYFADAAAKPVSCYGIHLRPRVVTGTCGANELDGV